MIMNNVENSNFEGIASRNWNGIEWRSHQPWGTSHHQYPNVIYSDDCVVINKNNEVELTIKQKDDKILMGLLSSIKLFTYGTYTIEVEMPRGKNIWPALWLCRHKEWPPEIDIMEGYYNNRGNIEGFLQKRIESTLHYITDEDCLCHTTTSDKLNILQYSKIDWNRPMEYRLYWGKNQIRVDIIQDNKKHNLFKTTKKKILDKFNGNDWYFIMNLHPIGDNPSVRKPFIIKKFKYESHD